MKASILSLLTAASLVASPLWGAIDFDLKDRKGVNNIVFLLDAPLESINGTTNGITGKVSFDPDAPEDTSGKMIVAVETLSVPNSRMEGKMMNEEWLDAKNHPEIVFELNGLSDVEQDGATYKGTAHGTMTIKGVSKEMKVPVAISYLEGKLMARQGTEGDILVVRSSFSISRSDFGVNEGAMEDKVADEVELRLSVAGFAPKG